MLITGILLVLAIATLPIWGMGLAVFLDSERTMLARSSSPDSNRVAQVERIIVGGAPSIVVMVRSWWMPDWYLTGCAAASHYRDAHARVSWPSNGEIVVQHTDDQRFWETGSAPFHHKRCEGLAVRFVRMAE